MGEHTQSVDLVQLGAAAYKTNTYLFHGIRMALVGHIRILYILLHMRIRTVHVNIGVIAKVNARYLRNHLKHIAAVA